MYSLCWQIDEIYHKSTILRGQPDGALHEVARICQISTANYEIKGGYREERHAELVEVRERSEDGKENDALLNCLLFLRCLPTGLVVIDARAS